MQAQDYAMAQWAVGVRLPHATADAVDAAVNKAEIIRTHVLRPTWHFIPAEDAHWMLELSAPHIRTSLKSRHKQLEITDAVVSKSYDVLTKAIEQSEDGCLTREEMVAALENANIATADNRAAHLFMEAEQAGLICSGAVKGKKQTYALLCERVPQKTVVTREEALGMLARRYFTSHSPATLQDFIWWSGLPIREARRALAMIQSELVSAKREGQDYWIGYPYTVPEHSGASAFLLPAFDEFLISYRDRSASLAPEHGNHAISRNGIFWPMVVVDGQVRGLWKRTIAKGRVVVEIQPFALYSEKIKHMIGEYAVAFGEFVGKKIEIIHKSTS